MAERLETINQDMLYKRYDVIFCDVWGVLHNGIAAFSNAVSALAKWCKTGKMVILVTNSPRLSKSVAKQLHQLKIYKQCYDALITSGQATRYLIETAPEKIYYIGTHAFGDVLETASHRLVDEEYAEAVVCTGLFSHYPHDLDSYRPLLKRLSERNLPFICANPDIVVDYGDQRQWCAGALAQIYENYGGKILVAGKPHEPIYQLAYEAALSFKTYGDIPKERILAIGDGFLTDVAGAERFGIDCLFIANGIHQNEYIAENFSGSQIVDKKALEASFANYKLYPKYYMDRLG